jgi:hypothetical protein
MAVLAVYGLMEAFVAHSVVVDRWWAGEHAYQRLHLRQASLLPVGPSPQPGWQAWLPSAVTALVLVGALVLVSLLLAAGGQGQWAFVVAALPLVPVPVAPGLWAPPLANQVAEALVWPPGARVPDVTWAWLAAGVATIVVLVPAVTLRGMVLHRRPRLPGRAVIRRCLPGALGVGLVLVWQVHADKDLDARTVAWQCGLAFAGALVVGGRLDRRTSLPLLLVLPAVAGGLVRWVPAHGAPGSPTQLVVDRQALWLSVATVAGVAWVIAQPALARWARAGVGAWWGLVRLQAGVRAEQAAQGEPVSRGPSRAAPVPTAGRHRD